jgi:RimJ/RimL family protein N-acetyltransferase
LDALAKEPRIWEFYTVNGGNTESLTKSLQGGLDDREKGKQYPFVIYHKADGKLIGSTRFIDIQPLHNKLEIGWTWLYPDYWASTINFECKLLLLTFAFESLGVYRVQFKVDVLNMRSRKAVEKIGGIAEGILRNDMVRENGTKRNSVYFSIIESEWPETKGRLQALLQSKLSNKAI